MVLRVVRAGSGKESLPRNRSVEQAILTLKSGALPEFSCHFLKKP
jgi:hypothetical protein